MFILNLKLTKSNLQKILYYLLLSFILIVIVILIGKSIKTAKTTTVNDSVKYENTMEISSSNYTNILKDCYDDLDKYIGKNVVLSGFIYRLSDFSDNQFVIGREMILSSKDDKAKVVVVGFLCDYKDAKLYQDKTWVKIKGKIEKGKYHSELPIINVSKLEKIEPPSDPYVYPPNQGFVKTETV